MKAFQCDRCNKYFNKLMTIADNEVGVFRTEGSIRKDLCPSCKKALQIWWRNVEGRDESA